MKVSVILLSALASFAASESTTPEPQSEEAAEEALLFVPATSVEENKLVINGTRYKLDDVQRSSDKNHVTADLEEYPDRMSLLHPNFWSYCIHVAAQFLALALSLKAPKALLYILVAAVLCWPISAIFGEPIWRMQPGASDWWLMCIKSIIVNICPTFPMLLCLINDSPKQTRQRAGIWTYCVLWANVFWTLFFLPMAFNAVSVTNAVCGLSLCISLIIHNVSICRKGYTLFEVEGDIIYGYGTSLSWLVCYTTWNALFVGELAVGLMLQDIAFWAMMVFYWYWSGKRSGIENYFAMARPISLSAYIATSDWPGLLDYFRKADPLGLDLTSHAFFLFIAVCNVIFSFYVLYWAICLCNDCGGAEEYFKTTFQFQEQLDDESEEDEESS